MNTIKKKKFESLTNEIFQYSQCVNNLVQIEYLRNGFNSYPIYTNIYNMDFGQFTNYKPRKTRKLIRV